MKEKVTYAIEVAIEVSMNQELFYKILTNDMRLKERNIKKNLLDPQASVAEKLYSVQYLFVEKKRLIPWFRETYNAGELEPYYLEYVPREHIKDLLDSPITDDQLKEALLDKELESHLRKLLTYHLFYNRKSLVPWYVANTVDERFYVDWSDVPVSELVMVVPKIIREFSKYWGIERCLFQIFRLFQSIYWRDAHLVTKFWDVLYDLGEQLGNLLEAQIEDWLENKVELDEDVAEALLETFQIWKRRRSQMLQEQATQQLKRRAEELEELEKSNRKKRRASDPNVSKCMNMETECIYKPIDMEDWCDHDPSFYFSLGKGQCFDAKELIQHFESQLLQSKYGNPYPRYPNNPWNRELIPVKTLQEILVTCQTAGMNVDEIAPTFVRFMRFAEANPAFDRLELEGKDLETIVDNVIRGGTWQRW